MNDIIISIIKDEKEINFLHNKTSFNYTFNKSTIDSLKKHFALKDSLYLIAKKGVEFVAFCSVDRDWWENNFFFIREILVDPNFQKLGIGKELMSRCIEHARNKNATGIITETDLKNYPMQKLCTKFNFKEWDNPQWKEGITYKLLFK